MTVGDLKKIIETMPDDAPVLVPGSDHSYYTVDVSDDFATCWRSGRHQKQYSEYFGDKNLQPGETKITALILR